MNPWTMARQPGSYLCHGPGSCVNTIFFRAANCGAKNALKQAYLRSRRNLGRENHPIRCQSGRAGAGHSTNYLTPWPPVPRMPWSTWWPWSWSWPMAHAHSQLSVVIQSFRCLEVVFKFEFRYSFCNGRPHVPHPRSVVVLGLGLGPGHTS